MSKIILFNLMSLDGFFEGKNKEIDWHNVDQEFNDFAIEQLNNASTLIFGRNTYSIMASYWSSARALDDDPIVAEKMNSIPKIVFSKTMDKVEWQNTKIAKGNIETEVESLKQMEKDVFILGSANLASAFSALGLIDEYRIMINPVILGGGSPMFKPDKKRVNLKLIRTKVFQNGNVLLCYNPIMHQ